MFFLNGDHEYGLGFASVDALIELEQLSLSQPPCFFNPFNKIMFDMPSLARVQAVSKDAYQGSRILLQHLPTTCTLTKQHIICAEILSNRQRSTNPGGFRAQGWIDQRNNLVT